MGNAADSPCLGNTPSHNDPRQRGVFQGVDTGKEYNKCLLSPFIPKLTFVVCLVCFGCGRWEEPKAESNQLEPIVRDLRAEDLKTRLRAIDELRSMAVAGLSEREGLYALDVAGEAFPNLEYEWQDSAVELVSAASMKVYSSYAPVIEANFASYSPEAQAHALRLLGQLDDRQAAAILLKVLQNVSDDVRLHSLGTLAEKPRHPDVLFPRIISYARQPSLQWPVSELILAYLKADLVDEESRTEISRVMITIHDALRQTLIPLQQDEGEVWIWQDAYQDARSMAALALDILGYVRTDEALEELSQSVSYKDPRLKMFAILGLLRAGRVSEPASFEQVAASAESRNWLYRKLDELDRLDLFSPQFMTRKHFAESDMVNWLTYPTELARVPDEIQLMAVVPREYSEGPGEFYVFRFRTFEPHWAAKDGWMVGVSGPFLKSAGPSPEALGGTFSDFTSWDECSAEEHVARIENLLDESRQEAGS